MVKNPPAKRETWVSSRRCGSGRVRVRIRVRKISCRRKWQLTPVFLPGKSPGQRSLAGCCPWSRKRVGQDLGTKQSQAINQGQGKSIRQTEPSALKGDKKRVGHRCKSQMGRGLGGSDRAVLLCSMSNEWEAPAE